MTARRSFFRFPSLRPLDRVPYVVWGVVLATLKLNLDRLVAALAFNRSWQLWDYFAAPWTRFADLPEADRRFFLVLLFLSLPFAAAGVWLTLRRLRSAGFPLWLTALFFCPVLNAPFFLLLGLAPSRPAAEDGASSPARRHWLPDGALGSAAAVTLVVGTIGLALAGLGTRGVPLYGLGLFLVLPFTMGLSAVLLYGAERPRGTARSLVVSALPVVFVGLGLLATAGEGLLCLIMAFPLGIAFALLGGATGLAALRDRRNAFPPGTALLLFAAVPFLMGMERRADPVPPLLAVTSAVVVDAPPEKVWPAVVAFPPIPERRELLLHTGIAYPTRARIDGQGVGAVRHCIFSTGEFVEPVEVWDPPRLLRFAVSAQPEPLRELSPYGHIENPHLHGYMNCREGEIRLVRLPDGRTRLEGTTWYTNRIWPAPYWRLWSDLIIHRIHLRVLDHIKRVSEAA